MFEDFSRADTLRRPLVKWLLLFLAVILILVVLASVFRFDRQNDAQPGDRQGAGQADSETAPLPAVDEALLQKQLQEIVATKEESDCDTLSDPRYQFACHDFFKVQGR